MSVQSPSAALAPPAAAGLDVPDQPLPPLPAGWDSLPAAYLKAARTHWKKLGVVDSLGAKLTFGDVLIRALILSRLLKRKLGDDVYVGLLVPPGAAGSVTNVAITMLGKIAVNLNYSASKAVIDSSIAQCGIKHVVTTPKILEKIGYNPAGDLIFLEDLAKEVRLPDKLWALAMARFAPRALLAALRPGFAPSLDKPATVIFTSGSTGDPKGVVLSHGNILSNVHQMNTHLSLLDDEVALGILPFFHSFGYTVCIWTVLTLAKRVVYHHSPVDYRIVPDLIEKNGVTLIASSPTFMKHYVDRARPGQLKSLVHTILGSEKLKPELYATIKEALEYEPMEGYGCTELSPVVSVNNIHPMPTRDGRTVVGNRPGTTGMPLPGTAIKTVDPETGADLPRGAEGVVWVKGPQVMMGYLNKPEATAKVLKDGWYCTGDIGRQDEDGFLTLTGRLSRFAKIGGEMVPLEAVEAAIQAASGVPAESFAASAVPDRKRGERLVVLYTDLGMTPEELYRKLLADAGLPRLWLPGANDFYTVEEIPTLGVGKRDLRRLKELATERAGASG
jgi:acyl-[acyl-carrier-protein]-phospholipid O-acyltransferase/long-chain-fatty-acid--[acyl-carrier-protein] ligase